MRIPEPDPGLVFRYDYIWLRESRRRMSGKDRPACLVAATARKVGGLPVVVILPITHATPGDDDIAIEIPQAVKSALGLDDERSWIIVSEYNDDVWPSPGLTPVRGGATFAYGHLPPALFARVRRRFLECVVKSRTKGVARQTSGAHIRRASDDLSIPL